MLVYLNVGQRAYAERAVPVYRRGFWEFQAVIDGVCGPTLDGRPTRFDTHRLWVFGPDFSHGWSAPADSACRIAVAHFDHVPDPLREWVGQAGMRSTALSASDCRRIGRLFAELQSDVRHPSRLSALRFEHALLELTVLAMRDQPNQPLSSQEERARRKVSQALAWYAEHLPDRPNVAQVAEAMSVSPSHLRRLFTLAGEAPPLAAMHRVQIERAKQLMQDHDLPLTSIARACGYSSLSVLSRSFRAAVGASPRRWRGTVIKRRTR